MRKPRPPRSRACCATRASARCRSISSCPATWRGRRRRPVPLLRRGAADPDALAECAEEIIEKLAQSSDPVILVDVEIRRYDLDPRVTMLARKLGIPVV